MKSPNLWRPWRLILLGWLTWSLAMASPGIGAEAPATLDLKAALALAWKANPTLRVSRLQSLIAGEEVVRARSGFLPTLKSEVSQTIYDDQIKSKIPPGTIPGFSAGTIAFPTTNRNFWSSKTYVEQTIFDFWLTPSKYQAAVLGKSASLLDTAKTRDDLFLGVAKGYFSTLQDQKLEVVAQENVTDLKQHLKIAEDQYQFGLVTFNDVLQAQVSLADAEQSLLVAKTDTIDSRAAFNKLLALPVLAPTVLKDEKLETRPWGLEDATEAALKQRSDLKASTKRITQQEKVVTQTRAQFFPRIYAQAGENYQQNDFLLHDNSWFGIFGLQWTLFSGLDTKAQVAQAKLGVTQLQEQHKDLDEQVRLDVQNAYLRVQESAARILVTGKAVTQAEENRRLNEERYKEQVGTATEVIDAQTLLTRTRVNYWSALYDHQMAKAELLWAMGAINNLLSQEKSQSAP
ncbi:MAG: TolC family protein [Desulfobaccales bacterium]|jgi:outer membrane protein TolC